MDRKKLLTRVTSLALFIFVVNYMAMKFYWYSLLWWFDMPMHFLGGFWAGLMVAYVYPPKDIAFKTVLRFILAVLTIGILWEIFEILVAKYITGQPFNTLDTLSDIFFDVAGGFLSIIYFSKRIMLPANGQANETKHA